MQIVILNSEAGISMFCIIFFSEKLVSANADDGKKPVLRIQYLILYMGLQLTEIALSEAKLSRVNK